MDDGKETQKGTKIIIIKLKNGKIRLIRQSVEITKMSEIIKTRKEKWGGKRERERMRWKVMVTLVVGEFGKRLNINQICAFTWNEKTG